MTSIAEIRDVFKDIITNDAIISNIFEAVLALKQKNHRAKNYEKIKVVIEKLKQFYPDKITQKVGLGILLICHKTPVQVGLMVDAIEKKDMIALDSAVEGFANLLVDIETD